MGGLGRCMGRLRTVDASYRDNAGRGARLSFDVPEHQSQRPDKSPPNVVHQPPHTPHLSPDISQKLRRAVSPVEQLRHKPNWIVEEYIGQQNIELFLPRLRGLGGYHVVPVDHIRLNVFTPDRFEDHTRCEGLLEDFGPWRGRNHQHLERSGPGFLQHLGLVEQPQWPPGSQKRLIVMVHHHGIREDPAAPQHLKCLDRFVNGLALLNQCAGHVFHAQPQCANARLSHRAQVVFHADRIVHGNLRGDPGPLTERTTVDFRPRQRFDDIERPFLVVEKIVIGPEENSQPVFFVQPADFISDSLAALCAVLALVVRRNRTVMAAELTAQRHHYRAYRAESVNAVNRNRLRSERGLSAGRLEKLITIDRVDLFVEIAAQPLNACINKLLRDLPFRTERIDQPRNLVEHPAVLRPKEGRSQRFGSGAKGQEHLQQLQGNVFLAGDYHVSAPGVGGVRAEQLPRVVDAEGPAGDDQRPMVRGDLADVAKHILAGGGVEAHAGDHEDVGNSPIQPHPRRAEVAIPLLKNDAGFVEPGLVHVRPDCARPGRNHQHIRDDERQHPSPVVERTSDDRRDVVPARYPLEATANISQLARFQQFIADGA